MKKYLLLMVAGIFGILTANAETWSVVFNADKSEAILTCTEVNGINHAGSFQFPNGGTTNDILNASTLTFKSADGIAITSLGAIDGIKSDANPYKATKVDYSAAVFAETNDGTINYTGWNPNTTPHEYSASVQKTKNCMSFSYFPACSNAILANVKTLCAGTFKSNSAMKTTFTIPASVEVIATLAVENTPITNITIPATVKYIEKQGFQNASIKALIDVTVEGYTAADNGAFDKQTTVGQTQSDYPDFATLHFPEGADEYFVNLEDKLDQATSLNEGAFQAWLDNHYTKASSCANPNGWKEFINAGGGTPEKPAKEVVLRTYSSDVACIVPTGFRAYLVTGVTDANVNGKKQYTLKLQQIFAIPAYTGVILYGEIKDKNAGYVLTKIPYWSSDPTDTQNYVAPYNRASTEMKDAKNITVEIKNYMVPMVEATTIYPYYKDAPSNWANDTKNLPDMKQYYKTSGTVTDRNFVLAQYYNTTLKDANNEDYWGFFRVKAGAKSSKNKAYLSLPKDVFKSAKGAEALVVKPDPTSEQQFRPAEWNTAVSTGNWGQRGDLGVLEAKFAGEIEEDEVTGISYVNIEVEEDGDYYNLQGAKVAQPQKGVYIKNGKKVIVK